MATQKDWHVLIVQGEGNAPEGYFTNPHYYQALVEQGRNLLLNTPFDWVTQLNVETPPGASFMTEAFGTCHDWIMAELYDDEPRRFTPVKPNPSLSSSPNLGVSKDKALLTWAVGVYIDLGI